MFRLIAIAISVAILCPSILGAPREVGSNKVYDCAVNYLRESDSLDKHFKYTANVTDDSDCDVIISLIYDKVHDRLKTMFEEDEDFSDETECIMEKLKTFNVADAYIEKFVYNQDKSMTKLRRQLKVSDAVATIELKLVLAEELCEPEKMFGDFFDEVYGEEDSNSTEVDDIGDLEEDYCQRKIMIERNLIDPMLYNIILNPSNINTNNVNCHKYWFEKVEEFTIDLKDGIVCGLDEPSKKEKRCITETIRNGNYTEQLLKVWMLSEVELTEAQEVEEKTKFITFMTNLYDNVMQCKEDEEEDSSEEVNSSESEKVTLKNIEFKNLF